WRTFAGAAAVLPALELDVTAPLWPEVGSPNVVVCVNMIHISPWQATLSLFDGGARVLPEGGVLYLYGPYRRAGHPTAPSNEAFDASLRARDPAWGLRDLEDVIQAAAHRDLRLAEVTEMPANNLSVVLQKTTS